MFSARAAEGWVPRMKRGMTGGFARVKALLLREGALLTSHGETIAGLFGLLKDGAQRRRAADGRRPVLDQPDQPSTLQPPRDLRLAPTWKVGLRPRLCENTPKSARILTSE